MDQGAHFLKCDFQVHTPRDINWTGQGAITEDERKEYAKEFIHACRGKGLDAVAITDHHDLVFFKFIKEAANTELDSANNPVPTEKKIVVFPGMELTLGVPCQAIIIFDAEFPVNLLATLYTVLAVNQTDEHSSKHAQPTRLEHFKTLSELYKEVNKQDYFKNRFIVLPNVSEGGNSTILRSGFHPAYKEMPCVGGYLDHSIARLGTGNEKILNGKDPAYGPKKLGIFQTSDNRNRDFSLLGQHTTWVKWATPTAEALRQACLAKESRISQESPLLPSIFITSIDVSNSKFMGQLDLVFNQQYNALIGGRGTGKSTILEYLRWGLCDQFPDIAKDDDETPGYQEKRRKLIEKTLLPYDSTVQISFEKNNIPHTIRRKSKTNELFLKIGTTEFEPCSEENVRNLLPIQAYSQKQLSGVGVRNEELKRLIYSPIRQTLHEFNARFEKLRADIRNCYGLRQKLRLTQVEIDRNELELKSLTKQVEGLRKELKGISDEDKGTISSHKQYEAVEQLVANWHAELKSTRGAFEEIKKDLAGYPTSVPEDVKLPDSENNIIVNIHKEVSDIFADINIAIESLDVRLDPKEAACTKLNGLIAEWASMLSRHRQQYETAKQKSTSQEATLNQIQKIEDRIKEVGKSLLDKKQSIFKTGDPEARFGTLKDEWGNTHREKGDLLEAQCVTLSDLSDNNLRSTLGRGKGTNELEDVLKRMISGSNIRKEKIEVLCESVRKSADPIQEWHSLLLEFEAIADFDIAKNPNTTLPATPILSAIGFTPNDLHKMSEKIDNSNWVELLIVQLDDFPLFEYRTRDGEYIEFADASAGQQATALMHVLLNQDGPPLIIDQPEDDLDNKMVSDIATLIWQAKKKRQLIFTSHNANIVVNGDAELVVCCGYKITGDQSKGEIKKQGAIDVEDIRTEITEVMEGGEEAFKLRKEKYGF